MVEETVKTGSAMTERPRRAWDFGKSEKNWLEYREFVNSVGRRPFERKRGQSREGEIFWSIDENYQFLVSAMLICD